MYTFLIILIVMIAVLLILVVLVQPGKGDAIAGMGTIGGSISSVFGSRKATDLLSKTTIGLAVALMFLVLVTNKFFVGYKSVESVKPITEGVAIPVQPIPATIPAPIQENQSE